MKRALLFAVLLLLSGMLILAADSEEKTVGPPGAEFNIDQVAFLQGGIGGNGYLEMAKGYNATTAYKNVVTESVDPFSGNLFLSVPLGGAFSAGTLQYGFSANYNSRVWEWVVRRRADNTTVFFDTAYPVMSTNAGMGWSVSLGDLYEPYSSTVGVLAWPNYSVVDWLYVAPDGKRIELSCDTAYPNSNCSGTGYPRAFLSSDLRVRMRMSSSTQIQLDMPNGDTHFFTWGSWSACSGIAQTLARSSCWLMTGASNAAGNWIAVGYTNSDTTPSYQVSDSVGRSHKVHLKVAPNWDRGTSYNPCWFIPSQGPADPCGEYRFVIDKVDINTQAGTPQTYTFTTREREINRSAPHVWVPTENMSATVQVPFLDYISGPAGTYSFGYNETAAGTGIRLSGILTGYTLPTLGSVGFGYQDYVFPKPCNYTANLIGFGGPPHFDNPHRTTLPGIASRVEQNPTGAAGTTLYRRHNYLNEYTENCGRPNVVKTEVFGPENAAREMIGTTYSYSVAMHDNGNWRANEYGLPINKDSYWAPAQLGGRIAYLSRQVWKCGYGNTNVISCDAPIQDVYDTYAARWLPIGNTSCEPGDPVNCVRRASVKTGSVTVYTNESVTPLPYSGTGLDNFDGFGSARRTAEFSSGFGGVAERTTYSHITPYVSNGNVALSGNNLFLSSGFFSQLPQPGQRWFVGRPQYLERSSGTGTQYSAHRTDYCYNANGLLTGQSVRSNAASTSAALVTWRQHGSSGGAQGLATKTWSEIADAGNWTSVCSAPASAPANAVVRNSTYNGMGYVEKEVVEGTTGNALQQTVNSYGFVADSTSPAGIKTTNTYDLAGRLLTSRLDGRAQRSDIYTPASGSGPAKLEVVRGDITLTVTYDGFGRPLSEKRTMPTSSGAANTSTRTLTYDAQGSVIKIENSNNQGSGYNVTNIVTDALGRSINVTASDGSITKTTYTGARIQDTEVVNSHHTREEFDGFGRVFRLSQGQSAPQNSTIHCTERTYDVADRVVSEVRTGGDCGTSGPKQTISRQFDGRGFLLSESRPEGSVVYADHTVSGAPTKVTRGGQTLVHVYDKLGRTLSVRDQATGLPITEYAYGEDGTAGTTNCRTSHGSYCIGQLIKQVRHNRDGSADYLVAQSYKYGETGGAVDQLITTVEYPNPAGTKLSKTFTEDVNWSNFGQMFSISYPACAGCGSPPVRKADMAYQRGMLMSIDVTTEGQTNRFASLSYNGFGNVSLFKFDDYAGSTAATSTEYAYKSDGERIDRITSKKDASATYFDSGVYNYHPMGHITSIGSDVYTYDRLGRLLTAAVRPAGTTVNRQESYEYNAFDFLTQINRTHNSVPQQAVLFTPNSANQITTMTGRTGNFVYDAHGNLTNDGCFIYEYDPLGALKAQRSATSTPPANCGTTLSVKHLYDANGMRVLSMCATCQPPPPPPQFTFSASPGTITVGQSATLTWSAVSNATGCTASGGWSGARATTGGSQVVTPTTTTQYVLTCTGTGGTVERTVMITVLAACPATITSHPGSVSVSLGGSARFDVTASGPPTLTYQWHKDGTPISGATSSVYNIANVQAIHVGAYTVVVRSTGCGAASVTSNPATLTLGSTSAYGGIAWSMPGRVEMENYDVNGQGVAYRDTTPGNVNGHYRSDDVDIGYLNPGYAVGAVAATEWWRYTTQWSAGVGAATTSDRNLSAYLRYAYPQGGAARVIGAGDIPEPGVVSNPASLAQNAFPETSAWNQYRVRRFTYDLLTSAHGNGAYRLYVYSGSNGINLDWVRQQQTPDMAQQTAGQQKIEAEDNFLVASTGALAGRQFCAGATCFNWTASAALTASSISRTVTASTGTGQASASITLSAASDHRRMVSASIKPNGSAWMAMGFLKTPTSLYWGGGAIWVQLLPTGAVQVLANGATINVSGGAVTIPTEAGFNANGFNLVEMWVDKNPSTSALVAVKVYVNGVQVVDKTGLNLTGLSLDYPGIGGSALVSGSSEFDDFRVHTARP